MFVLPPVFIFWCPEAAVLKCNGNRGTKRVREGENSLLALCRSRRVKDRGEGMIGWLKSVEKNRKNNGDVFNENWRNSFKGLEYRCLWGGWSGFRAYFVTFIFLSIGKISFWPEPKTLRILPDLSLGWLSCWYDSERGPKWAFDVIRPRWIFRTVIHSSQSQNPYLSLHER